jgi:hypothetical protein
MNGFRQQAPVIKGDPGFIAGGLDTEYQEGLRHEGILIQFAPLFVTERRS